jgi:hypothetical protein
VSLHILDHHDKSDAHEKAFTKAVRHGGRIFLATTTMATIFAAHARDVMARDETELVPLLHREGVDLLLITPTTIFTVVGLEPGDPHSSRTLDSGRGVRSTGAAPTKQRQTAS